MVRSLCCSWLVCPLFLTTLAGEPLPNAERVGPATFFMPDLERYEVAAHLRPERNAVVPQDAVTRETYFRWLEASGHFKYADNADKHGQYGPRHLFPVLAKYVQSGERKYGEACVQMLKAFDAWLRADVAQNGWHSMFIDEPYGLGLYERYLSRGGLLDRNKDAWFREMVLFMARNLHVWGTKPIEWRGPMHRAQCEGVMKDLAARWFSDAPEATHWKEYAQTVYQDFWRFKDCPPNDTGYYFAIILPLAMRAELCGDDTYFTDPGMKPVWERLMLEVSPDGAVVPYGAHNGWDAHAAARLLLLEMVAAKTRDGRYRFAAHRLMNYLLYQQERFKMHHILDGPDSTERLALAYLLADDTVKPQQPDAGSCILYRKETLRMRQKSPSKYLGPLDPSPDRNQICCGLICTDKVLPSKLVLRSGWNPGDFFALVDLFPRHDPLNAPGILGLTRWGSALTTTISAKGDSDENKLMIRDLSGKAQRKNSDPDLADPYYQELTVPVFHDSPSATFARVTLSNYQGLPATHTREFVFIKSGLLVCRDSAAFEAAFPAEAAVVFNTQNVGPRIGAHWAVTFLNGPIAASIPVKNPPVDLLVWFAPSANRRLEVVDRTASDPRTTSVPAQLRYVWKGEAQPGQPIAFTQVYRPQAAVYERTKTNAPGKPVPADADPPRIEALVDTPAVSLLRLEGDGEEIEWVLCNSQGEQVSAGPFSSDARYASLRTAGQKVASYSVYDATFLRLGDQDVMRTAKRENAQR
ncbi:MAG: hypothetical protein ABSE73_10305 [Planctomycetota bacterium]